jgi:hypothetical protein
MSDPAASEGSASAEVPADKEEIPVANAISQGLLSLVAPLVGKCDEGIQAALDSQAVLSQQIDRVAAEMQGFLSASQLPSFSTHAQRLVEVRRRVAAADATMAQVQARLSRMEQLADRLEQEEGLTLARRDGGQSLLPASGSVADGIERQGHAYASDLS